MLPTMIKDQLIHAYIHSQTLELKHLQFMFSVYGLPWLTPETLAKIEKAKEEKWGKNWN